MKQSPLVSVITPFLNAERFLTEAVESVLAQTYDRWELFLIDDGSTDGSSEIARGYAARYPSKIRYLEHEGHANQGTAASRNVAIRQSKGTYVAPLDADDVWLPAKLYRQVQLLESHPQVAMVYGASQYWYGWTGDPRDCQRDYMPDLGIQTDRVYEPPALLTLLYPFGKGTAAPPSDIMVRRRTVEEIDGFVEEFRGIYQLYEDQFFLTKLYLRAGVYVSSECWDRYRVHAGSCMAKVHGAGLYDDVRQRYLERFTSYLLQHGIHDPVVWRAVENAIMPYRTAGTVGGAHTKDHAVSRVATDQERASPQSTPHQSPVVAIGEVNWGSLRRVEPVARCWGLSRGVPIDRYYIEQFLFRHRDDIQGRVLEVKDNGYTVRFGGHRVLKSDVVNLTEGHPGTTIVADLTRADHIPSDSFDCVVLTQTLQLIFDPAAALRHLHRILKPGGVLLATVPGITQIGDSEWADAWYWNFTKASAMRLFTDSFGAESIEVESHGNVLAATALLHGIALRELRIDELEARDPEYEVIITVRAAKDNRSRCSSIGSRGKADRMEDAQA